MDNKYDLSGRLNVVAASPAGTKFNLAGRMMGLLIYITLVGILIPGDSP